MQTINPSEIAMPQLHEILLNAIAPRPIAFVSTVDKDGAINLAPFSFFNVFGSNPPTLIFSPARSGRTGDKKHTHTNILETNECVVNIANYDMLYNLNLAAGMYPKGTNEFEKSGLTALPSVLVKAPRVAECFVQFECAVKQVIETGEAGGAGNLIICEIKLIHIDPKVLNEEGTIDPTKMNYIARMGKHFWCRIQAEDLLTVAPFKFANELGMGYPSLPQNIRHSKYLTGNDIAQIASLSVFPTADEISILKQADFIQEMIAETNENKALLEQKIHLRAKVEIERGSLSLAFQLLMLADELMM